MSKRRNYRVNVDGWTGMADLLAGIPDEFNPDGASLRGRLVKDTRDHSVGQLMDKSSQWGCLFNIQLSAGVLRYVVYSYRTPIAWCADYKGIPVWCVPPVRYSVTTSRHQGRVNTAIHSLNVVRFESIAH